MTVLVACEYSGRVRDALLDEGIYAVSCDLLPSESDRGPHIQGDVEEVLQQEWDMVIAHPPCTYLANSGVRWRVERNEWKEVAQAARFFKACLNANAPYVAVENPVMHKYGREIVGRRPDFTVQPWMFGDPYKKRTCFWTKNLPPLVPTSDMTADDAEAQCHNEPPSKDRWKKRSTTYPKLAKAIAKQWGRILITV